MGPVSLSSPVQAQGSYLFTVCYANQPCSLAGSLPTFVNGGVGGSDLGRRGTSTRLKARNYVY
jgi:hypothetical protein